MTLEYHDTMVPSHEYGNIGNDTAKWDDGWFSDTIHARRFEGDILEVNSIEVSTPITGYLTADGLVPLTADWTTGVFSIIASDHMYMRADDKRMYFGEDDDSSVYFNGTNLVITTGAGLIYLDDDVQITGELTVTGHLHTESTVYIPAYTYHRSDTAKSYYGLGDDAYIFYNGSHFVIQPQQVGAGNLWIPDGSLVVGTATGATGSNEVQIYGGLSTDNNTQPIMALLSGIAYGTSGSGNMAQEIYGAYMQVDINGSYDGNVSRQTGFYGTVSHYGSGTMGDQFGVRAQVVARSGCGDVTNQFGLYSNVLNLTASVVTNSYGLFIEDVAAGVNSYSIFTNAGLNHFGDDVEVLGDLYFEGAGSGLPYAEIYAYDQADTLTIGGTGIGNKIQITTFDSNGVSNLTTPDHTNDHITVTKAGDYRVTVAISASSTGAAAYSFGFAIYKNDGATLFQNLHAHREFSGAGGDTGSVSISGIATFAASDTIEVWCWNETNTNNLIIDDINLSVSMVGGA